MKDPNVEATAVVRVAAATDAAGVAEAHVASWRAAYRGLMPQSTLDGLSVGHRTGLWARSIAQGDLDIRVAEVDGAVAGFAATGASRDDDAPDATGELYAIYLHPSHWDTGVGRLLHDASLAALAARFDEATLWVLDTNARARAFYERRGWRTDGGTKHDTIAGAEVAEVRYRQDLGQHSEG